MFSALALRRRLRSCEGSTKRMSLLPACKVAEPFQLEPSTARRFPAPLEKTTKRRTRVFAETRRSSGAYTVKSGAGSVVGAWMTLPMTLAPGGGDAAVAGFDLSTVTVP